MNWSNRYKENYEKGFMMSPDHPNEGTAARTRPFSYDEIMLRRKANRLSENEEQGPLIQIPEVGIIEKASDHYGSTRSNRSNKDTCVNVPQSSLEDCTVERSKKTDRDTCKDDYSAKAYDHHGSERTNGQNIGTSVHVPQSTLEDCMVERSKKKHRDTYKGDYSAKGVDRDIRGAGSKSDAKHDTDLRAEAKGNGSKNADGRRKSDKLFGSDSRNEHAKNHSRAVVEKDRDLNRNREKSEREKRGNYYNGVDEKSRTRDIFKKQNLGKGHSLQKSDRREGREMLKSYNVEVRLNRRWSRSQERDDRGYNEDARPNRRRSRSREHDDRSYNEELRPNRRQSRSREHDYRSRRSVSHSPRSHKRSSYHGKEHRELSSQMLEERSRREHTDTNRGRDTGMGSEYRKHGFSTSGLGGYSPRKRKAIETAKTPLPIKCSPEKKSAKWDLAPEGIDVASNFLLPIKLTSSTVHEVVSNIHASSSVHPLSTVSSRVLPSLKNVSADSIELTQSTRPMRRLYIENLPASASEKAVMEWLNSLLISSGINHVQGTQPCISCTIHKEKGQALVELLTPEHATAAYSFDGSLFSGSSVCIRRPKDFVEVAIMEYMDEYTLGSVVLELEEETAHMMSFQTIAVFMQTGEVEKSAPSVDAVSDLVVDSPHKIFIGGISQALSAKMLMEIASVFGSLKAFQFEKNQGHDKAHAFLEYTDQSVTLKACAGLNGMKLGGQVITAVQAIPSSLPLDNNGYPPFCGIPEHAKPLLEKPMPVLMLRNVFKLEALLSLASSEIEEVLEDVHLECARFGTVKTVNVVKHDVNAIFIDEVNEDLMSTGTEQNSAGDGIDAKLGTLKEAVDTKTAESSSDGDELGGNVTEDEPNQPGVCDGGTVSEILVCKSVPPCQQLDSNGDVVTNIMKEIDGQNELTAAKGSNLVDAREEFIETSLHARIESDAVEEGNKTGQVSNLGNIFEPGSVLVEFGRTEASRMAAHCLHGRLFDDHIVAVEYVSLETYRAMFPN